MILGPGPNLNFRLAWSRLTGVVLSTSSILETVQREQLDLIPSPSSLWPLLVAAVRPHQERPRKLPLGFLYGGTEFPRNQGLLCLEGKLQNLWVLALLCHGIPSSPQPISLFSLQTSQPCLAAVVTPWEYPQCTFPKPFA